MFKVSLNQNRKIALLFLLVGVSLLGNRLHAQTASSVDPTSALTQLVQRFTQAQHDFDRKALDELTTQDYVEVSPLGEVDPRERMLGFYTADKKVESPAFTISEVTVRSVGETGIMLAKISYSIPNHPTDLRAMFVARRIESDWKLISTQYTGIRAPKQSGAK